MSNGRDGRDVQVTRDAFLRLRLSTPARIGLGRAGVGLPTRPLLDFRLAHAMARDAVRTALSDDLLAAALRTPPIVVASGAPDRSSYLQRPDLGRRLEEGSAQRLQALGMTECDAVIVIADGLSATAAHRHGPALTMALQQRLADWRLAPVVVAHQARVAIADEIGERLGAQLAVILIGERPGLSAPDSLSAYITWQPRAGRLDSERNCISNIRPPHGMSHEAAADGIAGLMRGARSLRLTGIGLKHEQGGALPKATQDQDIA